LFSLFPASTSSLRCFGSTLQNYFDGVDESNMDSLDAGAVKKSLLFSPPPLFFFLFSNIMCLVTEALSGGSGVLR